MRISIWIGAVLLLAVGGYVLHADDPKPAPPKAAGDFTGKVVYVQTKGGVKSAVLDSPSVRVLGTRSFLVGKSISDDSVGFRPFVSGAEIWAPVDELESFAVFDDLRQLRRSAGQ